MSENFRSNSHIPSQFIPTKTGGVNGLLIAMLFAFSSLSAMDHPGDSIISVHTDILPTIDGDASDAVWNDASWVDINYMWMPYNTTITTSDFAGRYKVLWNKTTNLLYFLVEITDDKFVNGYVYSKSDGSYPLFDVLEVFIDEDRPGSEHGCNNTAYAYHITGGHGTVEYEAIDIYDPKNNYSWGDGIYVNNSSHLPEFKRTNVGTKYIWEFSLMALKSTYTPNNDPTLFKATLVDGKKMGLTLAYCDNDNSAVNPQRDNFIASKYETDANKDISWQNSTTFAHLTLKENSGTTGIESVTAFSAKVWVDGAKQLNCKLDESWNRPMVQLLDISGRVVVEKQMAEEIKLDLSSCKQGFYLVVIKENQSIYTQKIIL